MAVVDTRNRGLLARMLGAKAAPGVVLFLSAILGIWAANSPLSETYKHFLHLPLGFSSQGVSFVKPFEFWVNDLLMAIFFLMVGLEIKREFISGELSSRSQALLPLLAAFGGMLFPAIIYVFLNYENAAALRGWAIPCATDIAFSLGILALLGRRASNGQKVFLTALAIFDDLGAIIIIALFYTAALNLSALGAALAIYGLGLLLNRSGIKSLPAYLGIFALLWCAVLASGIHATLAGVAAAFLVPYNSGADEQSPLIRLEHGLHKWVSFIILPVFAFINSGVDAQYLSLSNLGNPISLGVLLGLFFGKQLGIFVFSILPIRLGRASMPEGAGVSTLYGLGLLGGVGFTMSLFISGLAFPADSPALISARAGILYGSGLSGVLGWAVLRFCGVRSGTGSRAD